MATTLAPIGRAVERNEQAGILEAQMKAAVLRVAGAAKDALTSTKGLNVVVVEGDNLKPHERIRLEVATPDGRLPLLLMEGAHEQLRIALDMDSKFYNRLLTTHPDMLAFNLGELMHREPQRRMLRMLNPEFLPEIAASTGRVNARLAVRAIVSDSYKPLDCASLINTLLPSALENDLRLVEWNLNEKSFHIRFAGPERTIGEIRRAHGFADDHVGTYHVKGADGKDRAWVNEVMSFGVAVSNSETGHGSLQVRQSARVVQCLNDYVKDEVQRTRHAGKKHEEQDGVLLAADTRRLEAALTFNKVRDYFVAAVGEQKQLLLANRFAEAIGAPVAIPDDIPMLEFVDLVGQSFELSDAEREILQDEVVQEMGERGQRAPTRFTIAQGMTAAAKRADKGFDRKQQLEEIGWRIIDDPTTMLVKAAAKAAAKK